MGELILRLPREDEEGEFLRAHHATSPGYPSFLHYYEEGMPFRRYLEVLAEQARGIDVPPDHVPTTFLFAFVSDRIVGRVSIRHRLNPLLERTGGHIGYVVVPEFRRRGYATEILKQALRIAHDNLGLRLALVTCDDDNAGSARTIEKCGGVLDDIVDGPELEKPKRRYRVETEAAQASAAPPAASPFEVRTARAWGEGRQDRVKETIMDATIHIGSTSFSKPEDNTLIARRTFAARGERVWAAHTQCEHVKQWLLGPEGWTMPTCEIDLRPGGKWRYVYEGPEGAAGFSFSGEYQEVEAPKRLVNTETMDDGPVHTLNTLILTEEAGHTALEVIVEYPSSAVREQILATGMMDGWAESYDRLDGYLASMK